MNLIKKQSAGVWANLLTVLVALVAVIVYAANIAGAGYFHNAAVSSMLTFSIPAILMLVVVIALAQLNLAGGAATAVEILSGVLRIAAPALLTLCLINLIAARVEGLGFIYFSNADVLLEVQTPENLSSATGTIANMVCLAVAVLFGMVSAFFGMKKKA